MFEIIEVVVQFGYECRPGVIWKGREISSAGFGFEKV